MSRRSTGALERQTPVARATTDLTSLSTFETLIATGLVCVGIWAVVGLTVLGRL